jgi:hypothetical protein
MEFCRFIDAMIIGRLATSTTANYREFLVGFDSLVLRRQRISARFNIPEFQGYQVRSTTNNNIILV